MSYILRFAICLILSLPTATVFAWGPEGHAIVGRLAMQMVKADTKQNVLNILNGMSIDSAANWMDMVRSNMDYDFMKPWHYVDFAKGSEYKITITDNIVNRLYWTQLELENKKVLCDAQIKMDLYILLHLIGDLHMPLHTGYDDDLGGNKVMVQYGTLKNHNLHRFWDEDIIRLTGITDASVLLQNTNFPNTISKADYFLWMKESRGLLDKVYNYDGFILDKQYVLKSKAVVELQLYKASVRLAYILDKLFPGSCPSIDFKAAGKAYKNLIDAKDAISYVGKYVTVCSKIYGIRFTDKITQINLGAAFPNSLITVIIFSSNYDKFKQPIAEFYKDKNICVSGKVELYKGKPQIIVEGPDVLKLL